MENLVPTEDDIKGAVKRLNNHSSRGTSEMQAEHLKRWLAAEKNKDKEEAKGGGGETTESSRGGVGLQRLHLMRHSTGRW